MRHRDPTAASSLPAAPHAAPLRRRTGLALAAALALPRAAWAQAAPMRLLTGFPTGIVDQVARQLAEGLGPALQRSVIVEAHAGASGRLALEAARGARADGDTLVVVPHGAMTLFPHVFRALRYDPERDFAPVAQLATFAFALGAAPQVPAARLQDMPAWVRGRAESTAYCSPGMGTVPHFLGERYAASTGLALLHVPFKSPAEILPAVMGNQVPLVFLPLGDLLPAARAGKLRLLATTGAARAPQAPEVPTFLESGIDLQVDGWIGLYAPQGVPAERLARIAEAARQAVQAPRARAALDAATLAVSGADGAALARVQAEESRLWADTVRRAGFRPE